MQESDEETANQTLIAAITSMSDTDVFLVADTLVSEWLRRTWEAKEDASELSALRIALQKLDQGIVQSDKPLLADTVRRTFLSLVEVAPFESALVSDISFAIDFCAASVKTQSGTSFTYSLGFSIALILFVAKLEGTVDAGDIHLKFQSGIPANIEKVVAPFKSPLYKAVERGSRQIKAGLAKPTSTRKG